MPLVPGMGEAQNAGEVFAALEREPADVVISIRSIRLSRFP